MTHAESVTMETIKLTNSFIKDAPVVVIDLKEASFYPGLLKIPHAVLVKHHLDRIAITITESFPEPLMIKSLVFSKVDVTIEQGVKAHVVMMNSSSSQMSMHLCPHAQVDLYCVQHSVDTSTDVMSLESLAIKIDEDASLRLFELSLAMDKTERAITVDLEKPHASVSYFGLDQLFGAAKKSSTLMIRHCAEKTKSQQAFRGIYAGTSEGSFIGTVIINQNARLSEARQLYKAIIVHEGAKAHVLPQLEIYNNDIQASHGASIGELDNQALFYLCSRGLSLTTAKTVLLEGMVNSILGSIEHDAVRNACAHLVEKSIETSLVVQ